MSKKHPDLRVLELYNNALRLIATYNNTCTGLEIALIRPSEENGNCWQVLATYKEVAYLVAKGKALEKMGYVFLKNGLLELFCIMRTGETFGDQPHATVSHG